VDDADAVAEVAADADNDFVGALEGEEGAVEVDVEDEVADAAAEGVADAESRWPTRWR
jgi:hypothetical protein